MNVKGASASGKSTMRSFQRELAGKIGVPWEDFALISPDYWRKFLLDYGSLGEDYKYAASLTGHELSVIDLKLDRHMARKAEGGQTTHMLIDRFRFDSFSAERDHPADSSLLTRFGKTIYLFFMVTPPEATVERAWTRGLETGRFKAVDDLLYHNIEAFTGMSQLFFQWALSKGKDVHFEFLDNSVPKGQRPRTIASGWNGAMNVYDVGGLLNIERFQRIDIAAKGPDGLYRGTVGGGGRARRVPRPMPEALGDGPFRGTGERESATASWSEGNGSGATRHPPPRWRRSWIASTAAVVQQGVRGDGEGVRQPGEGTILDRRVARVISRPD